MTVLLCDELPRLGLDPGAIAARFAARHAGAEIRIVRGPCARCEGWLDGPATAADRLVLGLCSTGEGMQEFEVRARRCGLDPFAIAVVDLGAYCRRASPGPEGTEEAVLLLEAGLARARAHHRSRPEGVRPVLALRQRVDRRSLFTLPPLRYESVPVIRDDACVASRGCRTCVTTCPREALAVSDGGRIVLSKTDCTGCGACVSACPVTAIDYQGASPAQIEAQLAVLLSAEARGRRPRGILFVCSRAVPALERQPWRSASSAAGWVPVEVPCLGMVAASWILECLNQGAAEVALVSCARDDCRFGRPDVVADRVAYCRELLPLLGGPSGAVKLVDPTGTDRLDRDLASLADRAPDALQASPSGLPPRLRRGEIADTLVALARRYGASPDRALEHAASPLGAVTLREGCTACGACASGCPTGALSLEREMEPDGVALSFAHGLCVACERCVGVCPEAVLRLGRRTDLGLLATGRRVLHRDRQVRCERCGGPVATRALLDRMAAILGSDPALSIVARYCAECRGTLA